MTEDAFARRFYADRAELDALGIQLRVDKPAEGFSEQENYSLAPEAFHLPAIAFTDEEHASLQTALKLLDGEFAYAEPLRLALQQITWGRPSPLDSPEQRSVGLGITASAGGAEVSARLAKIDTAIYRRKRIEFEYFTMQSGEVAQRRVDPYQLVYQGGQFYLVGHSHERDDVRVFRLSRIRGKVAYATKAEHDFQRPADFDPRVYANRIPWQLGDTKAHRRDLGLGPHRLARRAQLRPLRRDGRRRGRRRPRLPHRLLDPAARDRVGARLRRARAHRRAAGAGRRGARAARRDRRAPPGRAVHEHRRGPPARRRRPRGRRAAEPLAPGGRDPARALRPPRHARLRADRRRPRGPPPPGQGGLRAAADLRAGAARGHQRAQRRQLRRRRLRALRRGPGQGDRGRPRALLRHLRPPRAAAADRGQRADRRHRLPRRAPVRAPRDRAREDRERARRDRRRGPAGRPRRRRRLRRRARGEPRDRGAPADRARVLRAQRGPLLDAARSSRTR